MASFNVSILFETPPEIQRLAVLQDVRDHRITQVRAAEILNLSTRQITRLLINLN